MPDLASPFGCALGSDTLGDDDLTDAERSVRFWLISLWPPGVNDLYDLDSPDSDVANYFSALAQVFCQFGTSFVDTLRSELNPATAVEKLPDWETAVGIMAGRRPGATIAARQAAVISKLRESGSYSLADLRAILGPLLGYADPSQLAIIECQRATVAAIHTYANHTGGSIAPGASLTQQVVVTDAPGVSGAGVQVHVTISAADISKVSVRLSNPGGATSFTWAASSVGRGAASSQTFTLRSHAFDGLAIGGVWSLSIFNDATAPGSITLASWDIFVEGAGRDANGTDGLGAQVFKWFVLTDPALVGATHAGDLDAARSAIARSKPAHTGAFLVGKMTSGGICAICDDPNAIVDECVSC